VAEVRVPVSALPTDPKLRAQVLELVDLRAQVVDAEADLTRRRAAFLRALRRTRDAGVTPTELARALGISRGRVHNLLRGGR
jgi:DNA-binding MarR family transcriptional regulator